MNQSLLEKYTHEGQGYNPFLIRPGWQVAKLNHMPEQDLTGITKIDVHRKTDEVFVLVKGTAILITVSVTKDETKAFSCEKMMNGITYNIPKDVWHNIAMSKDGEVIIIEKDNTHLGDFEFIHLNTVEKNLLTELIMQACDS